MNTNQNEVLHIVLARKRAEDITPVPTSRIMLRQRNCLAGRAHPSGVPHDSVLRFVCPLRRVLPARMAYVYERFAPNSPHSTNRSHKLQTIDTVLFPPSTRMLVPRNRVARLLSGDSRECPDWVRNFRHPASLGGIGVPPILSTRRSLRLIRRDLPGSYSVPLSGGAAQPLPIRRQLLLQARTQYLQLLAE